MEGRSTTGSQESHDGTEVKSDQGHDGWTMEPGGARWMMSDGGAEGANQG